MTIKIPIRTIYNANGDPTGLGEFQSGEVVGYLHGGTGLSTIGTAGQILKVNDSANAFEFGDLTSTATIRSAISVTDAGGDGSLAYNSSTGVLTYTGPSATETRAHFQAIDAGGDGSFAYDSATGNFTYTVPSASDTRAHFSGGTGVTISSGTISIGQAVATTSNVTFNDLTVDGDLTVNGTTTTINSTTLTVDDKNIVVASGAADSAAANGAGITVDTVNATITYASSGDKWVANKQFDAPNFNSTSDERLKENIETITEALDKVDSIRGVTFTWKENGKASMGVIAQEVETIAPEVVSETNGYKAVNYDGLIGLLIESIKELKQEIADLKQN